MGVLLPFPRRHNRVVQSTDDDSTSPRSDFDALRGESQVERGEEHCPSTAEILLADVREGGVK